MALAWRDRTRERLGRVTTRQLLRSIWLGTLIGLVAGGGAILFAVAIQFATDHLLGVIAGYYPPAAAGEGDAAGSGPARAWALPFVLGVGGLISGALVFTLAPEAEGHGTDAAIGAYHRRNGRTRFRAVPVKLVASAITIGSGGAAGREGPTAQIGGGFGSWLADRLKLDAAERRRALAAGMGAGIGAIFRAPLGGALMAAEVLYKHDFEAEVILVGLISAIVGYSVYGTWAGWDPIFGGSAGFTFSNPTELPYYAVLGLGCGAIGLLYARTFYGTVALFGRIPLPRVLKPAAGGVLVGLIGMVAPESIHVGYGVVQGMMTREGLLALSPWLLLMLPFLRILTTSLSVGSGGSGGIFGPGMVIGGVLGGFAWRFGHELPGFPAEPGPVVIICMIAAFGSIAHVPLAMLLMVGEMTGNLSLLAPAMVAVAVATLVVGDTSIYESQVPTRADSPAHRHRFAFPLLSALPLRRAVQPAAFAAPSDAPSAVAKSLGDQRIVLVIERGRVIGGVPAQRVLAAAEAGAPGTMADLAEPVPVQLEADTPLDEAFDVLASSERSWLPVVDPPAPGALGVIDARALIRSYRAAAATNGNGHGARTQTFDVLLNDMSPAANQPLHALGFPDGARVVTIIRGDAAIVPAGETVLRPGDQLSIALASPRLRTRVIDILRP